MSADRALTWPAQVAAIIAKSLDGGCLPTVEYCLGVAVSRFIRLYEKKRGDRRTGSRLFGNLSEALFFGFFLIVGCIAFAGMFGGLVWPEWRANRQFAAARCVVLGKQVHESPATENDPATYLPEIHIRYEIDGRQYDEKTYDVAGSTSADRTAVEAMIRPFDVGQEYPCWYDPIDPHRVVLVRGYSGWLYLLLLIPISFIAIGGAGVVFTLVHWNTSDERRALLAQRTARLDLFDVEAGGERNLPTVPASSNITNSPGTTLAYRLPIAAETTWSLTATAIACLCWNGIVAIFVVMAVQSHARGEPNWFLTAFIAPFLVAGLALIGYFVRQFVVMSRAGTTRIEISHHPLRPGERGEILLSQVGRATMNSLEIWLVCDEKASYRQGTDTRIETRRVYEHRCFTRENFQIHAGTPFEIRCSVAVPDTAMHSFASAHNAVSWKLMVKGNVVGWPQYQRAFQIVVAPSLHRQSRHEPSAYQAQA